MNFWPLIKARPFKNLPKEPQDPKTALLSYLVMMGGTNPLAKWLSSRLRKDRSAFVIYQKVHREETDSPTYASDSNTSMTTTGNPKPTVSNVLDGRPVEEQDHRGSSEQGFPTDASEVGIDVQSLSPTWRNFTVSIIATSEIPSNASRDFTPIRLEEIQDGQILHDSISTAHSKLEEKNQDVQILYDSISTDPSNLEENQDVQIRYDNIGSEDLVAFERPDEPECSHSCDTTSLFEMCEKILSFLFSCSCENDDLVNESHAFDSRTLDSRSDFENNLSGLLDYSNEL